MVYTSLVSCDGYTIWIPAKFARGRRRWLSTWSAANLVALPGAVTGKRVQR